MKNKPKKPPITVVCVDPKASEQHRRKHPKGSDPLGMRRAWEQRYVALHPDSGREGAY